MLRLKQWEILTAFAKIAELTVNNLKGWGLNQCFVSESAFKMRIRIQQGKYDPQKYNFFLNFIFWSPRCSLVGWKLPVSWMSLVVAWKKVKSHFNFKTIHFPAVNFSILARFQLGSGSASGSALTLNAGSGSKSALKPIRIKTLV